MAKKKIKDLTIVEIEKICNKSNSCDTCPLDVCSSFPKKYCMKFIIEMYKKELEKEIEVPDND